MKLIESNNFFDFIQKEPELETIMMGENVDDYQSLRKELFGRH